MTASVTRGRALRCAEGSARGLLHHVLGHCLFNHFNSERSFYSRANFKKNRAAALTEWRQLGAA